MSDFLLPIADRKLDGLLDHLSREQSFVFLETTRVSHENHLSYLFLNPEERLVCREKDDPILFLQKAQNLLDDGYHLAGWVAYEFGYLLEPVLARLIKGKDKPVAEFGVYRKPFVYDHRSGGFVGEKPWSDWDSLIGDKGRIYNISNLTYSLSKEAYLDKVGLIKKYIESGDTYQVNYTLKLLFDYEGSDPALYKALRRNQSVSYGAFIKNGDQRVLSFSPELFFRKSGNECLVRPMKGTIRRAAESEKDGVLRGNLAGDIKNRSENVMIVDLLRNDLGRLSVMGKVDVLSLFDVETYETLHQMTSSVRGELKPDVSLGELFQAIFPCGSVTGAPKIRTMEIIRELEHGDRGVYTGGVGFISPEGEAVFNVPIRTVVLDKGRGEMGIGSGIVYDSDPESEWDECCLKARFLLDPNPGFQLIETLLWDPDNGFWLFERHLDRLSASALYWRYPFTRTAIIEALEDVVEGKLNHQRVRLLLNKDGTLEASAVSLSKPSLNGDIQSGKVGRIAISSTKTNSSDPFLYHKTTRREIYDEERQNFISKGLYEVVFCNERGELTEGAITNIFIKKNGELLTPPLGCGLLAGVFRGALLAGELSAPEDMPVKDQVLTIKDLEEADAVYVGNSVRGLVRVELSTG